MSWYATPDRRWARGPGWGVVMLSLRVWVSSVLLSLFALLSALPLATAATFTVSNTNDAGPGSLRQAVIDANADGTVDSIEFAIPEGLCAANGVCSIVLASILPDITEGVVIDGTTQPRYGTARANVCAAASTPSYMRILVKSAADFVFSVTALGEVTLRGLAIAGGGGTTTGIRIDTNASTTVQCNHLGADGPGTASLDLTYAITLAWWAASGGNAIIGTDGDGIDDRAERNVFGGGGVGVYVNTGSATNPNRISGNFFGVGADGVTPIGLGLGVYMRQGATQNLIGSDLDGTSDDLERNVFAALTVGVRIFGFAAGGHDNHVVGNWFGIDAFGRPAPITGVAIHLGNDGQNQEIRNNQLIGNTTGIEVQDTATFARSSGQNCIVGNGTGLQHEGSAVDLNAEGNFWGSIDGPAGIGPGTGDEIIELGIGTVDYTPWLTSPAPVCILIMTDGFESGNLDGWSSSIS